MKKFFISLIAGIALVSCSKNDDNKKENPQESNILRKMTTRDAEGNSSVALYTVENGRLTAITHQKYSKNGTPNGTPEVSTFYYDSHNRIIKAVTTGSEGGADDKTNKYSYDDQGNLVTYEKIFTDSHRSKEFYEYSYTGKQLTKIFQKTYTKGSINGVPHTRIDCYEETFTYSNGGNTIVQHNKGFEIDAQGAVISRTIYEANTITYTLSNGNVVKTDNKDSDGRLHYVVESTYDTKNNPLQHFVSMLALYPEVFSEKAKNNITKMTTTINDNGKTQVTTVRSEYNYNASGYPISAKVYTKNDNEAEKESTIVYEY